MVGLNMDAYILESSYPCELCKEGKFHTTTPHQAHITNINSNNKIHIQWWD